MNGKVYMYLILSTMKTQFCKDYKMHHLLSVIHEMKQQECTAYRPSHYLVGRTVTADDRKKLCQWVYSLADVCRVNRNTATVAITYFDRYLSCRGTKSAKILVCLADLREFQLAFITCFILAVKTRESLEVKTTFVAEYICGGMYDPEELVQMGLEILRTLEWRLNGPTPCDFIRYFVEILPTVVDRQATKILLADKAIKISEDFMADYSVALRPYSCIALACIEALDMKDASCQFYEQQDITLAYVLNNQI
jgi:hypothetical protein